MKEHDIAFVTSGFSLRSLLLAISPNPVKVFKCFTKLNRSWCSTPLSGALNFSLWSAEVLALGIEVSSVRPQDAETRPKLLL